MRVTDLTDAMTDLSRRLLTHEAADGSGQAALLEAADRVLDRLRAHLSKRIGQEGYRTLLARALALTAAPFPYLGTARIGADGSLAGLRVTAGRATQPDDAREDSGRGEAVGGAVRLIARLLELLVTFIGEDLTLRLIGTLWPALVRGDVGTGENDAGDERL